MELLDYLINPLKIKINSRNNTIEARPATTTPVVAFLTNCSIAKSHCLLILNSDGIEDIIMNIMIDQRSFNSQRLKLLINLDLLIKFVCFI
jgi:hypothetical protein